MAAQVLPHLPVPAHTAAALGTMQFKGSSGQIMTHLTPLLDNAFIITDLSALAVFYVIGARVRETSTGGSSATGVI